MVSFAFGANMSDEPSNVVKNTAYSSNVDDNPHVKYTKLQPTQVQLKKSRWGKGTTRYYTKVNV